MASPPANQRTTGCVGSDIPIEGMGTVAWSVTDTTGSLRTLKLPALYAPSSKVRLLSTSSLLSAYPNESIHLMSGRLVLSGNPHAQAPTNSVVVLVNPNNNLAISDAQHSDTYATIPAGMHAVIREVSESNMNLTPPEREWLKWHQRLGHASFTTIQFLMRSGILGKSQRSKLLHTQVGKLVSPPRCAACQYAKAKRRSVPSQRTHSKIQPVSGGLKKDQLFPGQEVSVDHFVCSTLGRLYTGYGKSSESSMYKGGAIFVDHTTSFVHVEHQTSLTSHDTLQAKEQYEFMCRDYGVLPQQYLSDTAKCFTSQEYTAHLRKFSQTSRYAGVGAHHGNGIAEKAIQDVMSCARTLLLHAAIHWPDQADPQLWPMAVDHAVFLHNHLPNPNTGLSPFLLFTKQQWQHSKYHELHVFGCPVYVLDKKISDGHKLPRWKPRSSRHVYMGFSKHHASSVPLTLNPHSGSLTAQYHVVFDDWFHTVSSDHDGSLPDLNSDDWTRLFGDSTFQYPDPTLVYPDDPVALSEPPSVRDMGVLDGYSVQDSAYLPQQPLPEREYKPASHPKDPPHQPLPPLATRTSGSAVPVLSSSPASTTPPTAPQRESPSQREPSTETQAQRDRVARKPSRMLRELADHNTKGLRETVPLEPRRRQIPTSETNYVELSSAINDELMSNFVSTAWNDELTQYQFNAIDHNASTGLNQSSPYYRKFKESTSTSDIGYYDIPSSELGYSPGEHPRFLFHRVDCSTDVLFGSAKTQRDPDTLSWDEAMAEDPDAVKNWLESAKKEIRELEGKQAWEIVEASEAGTVKVIPGTWVFRRKRNPASEITKWKARWVVRGDLQEVDFDTYAPVVAWSTVRIFMVISILLQWTMMALDFDNAFIQAQLDDPVYTYLPRGFEAMNPFPSGACCILRLKKSVYGLAIAPKLWYQHLLSGLKKLGFKHSSYDRCLLYKDGALLVTFVDDCGLSVHDPAMIDEFVRQLQELGFDFTAFLGVAMLKLPNGLIHMHQRGLIKKILKATGMEDCNPNSVPAAQVALGSNPNDAAWPQTPWRYSSIVGMLLYLANNTRPDIQFAVSQVARFNNSPKMSHASAVKTIIRYVKGTSEMGTVVHFTNRLDIVCYADADFAGMFGREIPRNPDGARSRGGYIIVFGGIPLIWKSWLMSAICLSTLESEYQCLSKAMTQLIALRNLIQEMADIFDLGNLKPTIACTLFKDNSGALILATQQRITTRTKYFHVKWHHFWSHVGLAKDGLIEVKKIDTKDQAADYLTKGLAKDMFENNRMIIQNW